MKRKASGESSFRRKSPYRPIMLSTPPDIQHPKAWSRWKDRALTRPAHPSAENSTTVRALTARSPRSTAWSMPIRSPGPKSSGNWQNSTERISSKASISLRQIQTSHWSLIVLLLFRWSSNLKNTPFVPTPATRSCSRTSVLKVAEEIRRSSRIMMTRLAPPKQGLIIQADSPKRRNGFGVPLKKLSICLTSTIWKSRKSTPSWNTTCRSSTSPRKSLLKSLKKLRITRIYWFRKWNRSIESHLLQRYPAAAPRKTLTLARKLRSALTKPEFRKICSPRGLLERRSTLYLGYQTPVK